MVLFKLNNCGTNKIGAKFIAALGDLAIVEIINPKEDAEISVKKQTITI